MDERKCFFEAEVEFAKEMFPTIVGPECQERHLEYRSGTLCMDRVTAMFWVSWDSPILA